jgi:hypothetical protein
MELAAEDHDPLAVDKEGFFIPGNLTFISLSLSAAEKRATYDILQLFAFGRIRVLDNFVPIRRHRSSVGGP